MCRYNRSLLYTYKVKKLTFNLKDVTMVDTVMGWYIISEYNDKIATTIDDLIETMCLTRYTWPIEIKYVKKIIIYWS